MSSTGWRCSECTYFNAEAESEECEMCSAAKPAEVKPIKKAAPANPKAPTASRPISKPNQWLCVCQYANPIDSEECEICQNPNPNIAPKKKPNTQTQLKKKQVIRKQEESDEENEDKEIEETAEA